MNVTVSAPLGGRPLTDRTLPTFAGRVDVPAYDRAALTPAVVHLGVGGFHRAHQAVYLDELARQGDTGWGEIGVGLCSTTMRDALIPQDCLYTVVQRSRHGDTARAVGSMIGYRYAPADPRAVLDCLADPRIRVVTLTITGDGYHLDDTGRLRTGDPAVRADLADPRHPGTAPGYLVEALDLRRRAGLPAFTVLSCDNLPDNGAATRAAVLDLARLRDDELAAWIETHASFPASMVDRITPQTDDQARRLVADRFGVLDRSPVITEPFIQWIVEDDFCNGRPPLERVGVQFVPDVAPYKLMKTRLLNAGHSALGYLGQLAGGYRTSTDAMANPVIADYLAALMREEIAPLLPPAPGVDPEAYQRTILERFANPRISDQLSRLCGRGSTKMPAYLLPSLISARREGKPALLLTLAVAGWFCYLRGYDLTGAPIEVRDARRDALQPLAVAGGTDPRPLLADRSLFGPLSDDDDFVTMLEYALHDLELYGPAATICDYLAAELLPGQDRAHTTAAHDPAWAATAGRDPDRAVA
ncbi:mannitol dehydrogenase family protein [Actinoplanes teichomyceticus]|uniref:Fructuronate reductase/mannitol 2-dehydrogenase n=1 Tax=Actinoplanes teichomyceticus TaxID=1867 RepID=A0A561WBE0_ACTTI|nr:mannitol dehydrogenase family protein [Actinoplanes teichomyceticus]TWG21163.1 fructuronate reductase/mannitol 2-dehydrogenase [Actinoplanes teichomyceticus]GIF14985.1 mannitol dehydrogenase [Actinoplanes teichomyceticus]